MHTGGCVKFRVMYNVFAFVCVMRGYERSER